MTQLLVHPTRPRMIALSASLDDLDQLDGWLRAQAVVVSERPVPLELAVCSSTSGVAWVRRDGGEHVALQLGSGGEKPEDLAVGLTLRYIAEGRQVIVFRAQISDTERMAEVLSRSLPAVGMDQQLGDALALMEDPEAPRRFRGLLASGVGFHNGDLAADERRLMEEAFRSRSLHVLVATTTLAMGVNMPADVVIIADHQRATSGTSGWVKVDIPVAEFRNAAGRAGRLGLKLAGLAVLIAEDDVRRRQLFSHYVDGEVEPVASRLPDHPLEDVVFRLLAGRVADTEAGLVDFLAATSAYPTWYESHGGVEAIRAAVAEAVAKTTATGLFISEAGRLSPTPVAHSLARAGVGLEAAVGLKSLVDRLTPAVVPRVEILFELSMLPESGDRPWVPGRPGSRQDPRGSLLLDLEGCSPGGALMQAMEGVLVSEETKQALLQCSCLVDWASGMDAPAIQRAYKGMSPHRLASMGGTCAWLLQALTSAAKIAGASPDRVAGLRQLGLEVSYGLPAELAPLARLRSGIARAALLKMYEIGIYQPDDVLEADPAALATALSPGQVAHLKKAILEETEATLRRFRSGHLRRTSRSGVPPGLIEALYSTKAAGLEQAVEDAINAAGLKAARVMRQPAGEEDVQVSTSAGTVVVSVTASQSDQKPVPWNKAKEVMAQGAGQNPVNCVCVARPRFEALAEQQAGRIARETGSRAILLITVPVLAEIVSRVGEGRLSVDDVDRIMVERRGLLAVEDLPDASDPLAAVPQLRGAPE
jgi:helicase